MSTTLKPQTGLRVQSIIGRMEGPAKAIDPAIWIMLLEIFIPMIIDCFDPSDGGEASTYVKRRYNASEANNRYGGYDKRLVKATARQGKRASRRARTRITWDQAYELAIKTLDDVREGDDQQTSLVIREHDDFMLI